MLNFINDLSDTEWVGLIMSLLVVNVLLFGVAGAYASYSKERNPKKRTLGIVFTTLLVILIGSLLCKSLDLNSEDRMAIQLNAILFLPLYAIVWGAVFSWRRRYSDYQRVRRRVSYFKQIP